MAVQSRENRQVTERRRQETTHYLSDQQVTLKSLRSPAIEFAKCPALLRSKLSNF